MNYRFCKFFKFCVEMQSCPVSVRPQRVLLAQSPILVDNMAGRVGLLVLLSI